MTFAARFSCWATIDFNSILKCFSEGVMITNFISKSLEFSQLLRCEKIVSTKILPKVLSIIDPFLDLPPLNFPLFRSDKAFCFFHYLTPSLKADLNVKQALCTFVIAKHYCFLHLQVSVVYTGLQLQSHTYFTFLVKDACTCIFCFHQTLGMLVLSVCWVLLCINHDRRISCYWSVKTLIENSLEVDNSLKSVQQFGNALWFIAASCVDDECFDDKGFAVRLLLLLL